MTRDRRELLRGCLDRLRGQTRVPDRVLVVDNQSSDGTGDMLRADYPDVDVIRSEENIGGAGGFHRGIEWSYAQGHEWIWLMDDDSWPEADALAELLAGDARAAVIGRRPLLLASQVLWRDGRPHSMNTPWPRWSWRDELLLGAEHGLLLLRYATFVSILVRREAVERFGLPLAHYFIWTDDFEYTGRVLKDAHGYLVPESVCLHNTEAPTTFSREPGGRFYYFVRNSLLLLRGTSLRPAERLAYLRVILPMGLMHLVAHRAHPSALVALARGLRDGARDAVR